MQNNSITKIEKNLKDKIYTISELTVMLDCDLAEFY